MSARRTTWLVTWNVETGDLGPAASFSEGAADFPLTAKAGHCHAEP